MMLSSSNACVLFITLSLWLCMMPLIDGSSVLSVSTTANQLVSAKAPQLNADAKAVASLGVQFYAYGLPMLVSYQTVLPLYKGVGNKANFMYNQQVLATAANTNVVLPNHDTVYSLAWLDFLSPPLQALVIHVPDTHGRYYVFQLQDFYSTNFADIGTRATGTAEGHFLLYTQPEGGTAQIAPLLADPAFTALFAGIIPVPGGDVLCLGRTYLVDSSPAELAAVHALQAQYTINKLDAFLAVAPGGSAFVSQFTTLKNAAPVSSLPLVPNFSTNTALRAFETIGHYMLRNPAPAADAPFLATLAQIGASSALGFQSSALSADVISALSVAASLGSAYVPFVVASGASYNGQDNGWNYVLQAGDYGVDYVVRAIVNQNFFAPNIPAEAIYLSRSLDSLGRVLTGAGGNKYAITIPSGGIPNGVFWSLTMYNATSLAFFNTTTGIYSIGTNTAGLSLEADGSFTVYMQYEAPTDPRELTNWLPAPPAPFFLVIRSYLPPPELLNYSYKLPQVTQTFPCNTGYLDASASSGSFTSQGGCVCFTNA